MSKNLQEEVGCMNPENSWGLLLQSAVWYLVLLVILMLSGVPEQINRFKKK